MCKCIECDLCAVNPCALNMASIYHRIHHATVKLTWNTELSIFRQAMPWTITETGPIHL